MREIAAQTHRSPTTVWKISQRVKNPVLAKPKKKQENFAPKITRHFISYALLSDPSTSAESMRKQLSIVGIETSTSTINRLVARMGFQSVYKAKKEKLDQRQRDKRVAFCRDIQLAPEFLLPWVFTDESLIVRNPTQGKIRVLRGIEEIEERFIETEGYPVKVMVWGCIGVNFKSTLMRIKGRWMRQHTSRCSLNRVFSSSSMGCTALEDSFFNKMGPGLTRQLPQNVFWQAGCGHYHRGFRGQLDLPIFP